VATARTNGEQDGDSTARPRRFGDRAMEILVPLAILVVWVVLQAWVLPRLGVPT
jgi:hypothetical protein